MFQGGFKVNVTLFMIGVFVLNTCTSIDHSEGARLYKIHCANCHMDQGEGLKGLIPPLSDTKFLQENRALLPCWIKNGVQDPMTIEGKEYVGEMPGVPTLTHTQIANIINFIQGKWHNGLNFYSEIEVKAALKECK